MWWFRQSIMAFVKSVIPETIYRSFSRRPFNAAVDSTDATDVVAASFVFAVMARKQKYFFAN